MKGFIQGTWILLVVIVSIPAIVLVVSTPMSLNNQIIFGVVTAALVYLMGHIKVQRMRVAMALITMITTTRYLYWRISQTLVTDGMIEPVLSVGLLIAECYAWLVLLLGFFQTVWPLERRIVPLPKDVNKWPTVDVYIPTYNESLEVVRDTVLAALNIDYPRDKLRIYLLDDGRRPEFGAFASAAGVGYITRTNNNHAKAGNLNNALRKTNGELICIFDCDHIPTRAFLQATAGPFCYDPTLALLQTPHHFYSPDPFNRNLVGGTEVPHEGELFYGPIQKGNDYWGATFFCGSCALLRRSALEEIGGFAVETVTEDAHTALKLQRKGWDTAYLGIPLAAGLATERLALHIGQRARWCRGMTQILRIDNPLLGRGLNLGQRLCYLSAMVHFQFPLPRFIFLTAPMVYLLFGMNIIEAAPQLVAAYVIPHLFCIIYTNSHLTGQHRNTFWNEVYETVLVFHMMKPSLITLLDPKRGKFNVTDKGGLIEEGFMDFKIVQPHIFVVLLLLGSMAWGTIKWMWLDADGGNGAVLFFNLVWAVLSAVFLLAAIASANERRQIRRAPRILAALPAILHLRSGHTLKTMTRDLSMGGVQTDYPAGLTDQAAVEFIEVNASGVPILLPVTVVSNGDKQLGLKFPDLSLQQRQHLVKLVMGRADAWLNGKTYGRDRPLVSLLTIFRSIAGLFFVEWRDRRLAGAEGFNEDETRGGLLSSWSLRLLLLGIIVLGIMTSQQVWGQVAPAATTPPNAAAVVPNSATPAPAASAAGNNQVLPPVRFTRDGQLDLTPAPGGQRSSRLLTFADMGQRDGLYMQGNGTQAGIDFSFRQDEVVTKATLTLEMNYSDAMLDNRSFIEIQVNGVRVMDVPLDNFHSNGLVHSFDIPTELLVVQNTLQFRLVGQTLNLCDNQLSEDIWIEFAPSSLLSLNVERIPPARDLSYFPAPFFDSGETPSVSLYIVLPGVPVAETLRAGAVVASHMGTLANYRGIDFPVMLGRLPDTDAIVFATPTDSIFGLELPKIEGPMLFQLPHPRSPLHRLLLVAGRTPQELGIAANFLALRGDALEGQQVRAIPLVTPTRVPGDSTRWQDARAPVMLREIGGDEALVATGLTHAPNRFSFRLRPDLFIWPSDNVKLNLEYFFPENEWLDRRRSRLEVMINGEYLGSFSAGNWGVVSQAKRWLGMETEAVRASMQIPPALLYGSNELSLYFNLAVHESYTEDCTLNLPGEIRSVILPTSNLDITKARQFTSLPNLSLFAAAGFPYTRLADASQTTLLLPSSPNADEISAAFNLIGHMAAATGSPAFGINVQLGLDLTAAMRDRDILVVSDADNLTGSSLLARTRFQIQPGGVAVRNERLLQRMHGWMQSGLGRDLAGARRDLAVAGSKFKGMLSFVSPLNEERSIVVLTGYESADLPGVATSLYVPEVNASIQGDLVSFDDLGNAQSFVVGTRVSVGELPWNMWIRWSLGQYVIPIVAALLFVVFVIAGLLYSALDGHAHKRIAKMRAGR